MAECLNYEDIYSRESGFSGVTTRDFKSLDFRMDELRQELLERGVAVIENVVNPDDCDAHVTQIHDWLAQFGTDFPSNIKSIIHKYRVSHLEAAWRVRLAAKPVFAQLWDTDKLLTSLDGIAVGQPPEMGTTTFDVKGENNLHYDQGAKRAGLHAFQGAVYLEEAQSDDWCFMVMEKSHKLHTEFFNEFGSRSRSEFRGITQKEQQWLADRGCDVIRIAVPKGAMVLWDSRTVHAGAPAKYGRQHPNRWRYVVFVCMGPAIWAGNEDLRQKKICYNELGISKHWPCNGVCLFKKYAKSAHDITQLPEVAATQDARLLSGVLDYDFSDGASNGPSKPIWKQGS